MLHTLTMRPRLLNSGAILSHTLRVPFKLHAIVSAASSAPNAFPLCAIPALLNQDRVLRNHCEYAPMMLMKVSLSLHPKMIKR
jgi:hypothetical protein